MDTANRTMRSSIMSRVDQPNTGPEMRISKSLHRLGFRYRLHDKGLPGSPDLVLPKYNAVIFVHGCFWHSHKGCKYATIPSTRREFRLDKFETNRLRDKRNIDCLLSSGWRVLVVWECATKTKQEHSFECVNVMAETWLKSDETYLEISG